MKEFFRVPNSVFNLRISSSEKLVLIYLYRCGNNSIAHPSYATIAGNCDLNRRTAIRAITQLEELGMISVERTNKRVNRYVVLI